MKLLTIFLLITTLNAGVTTDIEHFLAQKAYKEKNYKKALTSFKKLAQTNDIKFEIAMTLYRLKRYKDAIAYFKSIDKPSLNGAINYNIANCYFLLKDYKSAKKFFKNALKFSEVKALAKKGLKKTNKELVIKAKLKIEHCKGVMLGLGDLKAELFSFDDPFVSKNLKLAKLKEQELSNAQAAKVLDKRDELIENLDNNRVKKSDKIYNLNSQKEQRLDKMLQEASSKTLLIPIGDDK